MAVPLGVGPGTVCVLQPPLSWWAPVGVDRMVGRLANKDNPCDPGRKETEVPSLWLGLLNWVWGASQKSWSHPYPRGKRTYPLEFKGPRDGKHLIAEY